MPGKRSDVLTAVPAGPIGEPAAGSAAVPADADFFYDLGADSLLMAQFCARVRKRPELPAVSMKDVYRYPTAAALAAGLAGRTMPAPSAVSQAPPDDGPPAGAARGAGWFVLCGVLQVAIFLAGWFALAERAATGFRPLRPLYCSIHQPEFRRHERYWKLASPDYLKWFGGTPFKPLLLRLLGARVGRRVFDDGCFPPERSLVAIGDECTLNAGTVIQCHSQEDGAFKSDRTTLGAGCTLGAGAFVHYGVTLGDHAVLAPDSFLTKGEDVPAHAAWGGNPDRDMPHATPPPSP